MEVVEEPIHQSEFVSPSRWKMWNSVYLAQSSVILLAGSARGESAETRR